MGIQSGVDDEMVRLTISDEHVESVNGRRFATHEPPTGSPHEHAEHERESLGSCSYITNREYV